ncbi:MAG: biotin--[acetyl-CoA-carboxylase] ligase [Promicromonosporaceae bacterium]|nr:biotin--[acetyl-CoA-carboxylase] ligase [Promicromonosporaceae bacterium]
MERASIDVEQVRAAVVAPAGAWASVDVVEDCPSTNTELVARAHAGAAAPAALAAENQSAGLGRAGRTWTTPPRAALTVSALLRPVVPPSALGWLPLLAGLATVRVLRDAGVPAALKWPNDVLLPAAEAIDGFGPWRKVAGILAQTVPGLDGAGHRHLDPQELLDQQVVVGVGLNVTQTHDELPVPTATSLALAGTPDAALDRTALMTALLRELADVVGRWTDDEGDAQAPGPGGARSLADEYAGMCATLGQDVRADLAGGAGVVEGVASRLAADGALAVVRADGSVRIVAAGDVHHLRRADVGPHLD